jgi:putative addiction module killer protein
MLFHRRVGDEVGGTTIDVRFFRPDFPAEALYYIQRRSPLIVLLCGGDKKAQAKDIALALKLAKEV